MAGGMTSGGGPSLAQRSARSGIGQARAAARPGARHCWVVDLPAAPGRWPGLLAEWRQSATGWEGRVTFGVDDEGRCVLIEAWVPAAHLHGC